VHIKDISISSFDRSTDGKQVQGDVVFLIEGEGGDTDQRLKLSCETPFSPRLRSDAALIGSAIAKLRRLPGVRSGAERLTFEPGMRPLATQRPMDRRTGTG